jgi:chorismate mutase
VAAKQSTEPVYADVIDTIRSEIDELDGQIIELYRRRAALSRRAVELRVAAGGTRLALSREREIVQRYWESLGRGGTDLAMVLLEAGRGRNA